MTQKVLVSAENDLIITQFRAICSEIATSASTNEQRVFTSLNASFLTPIYSPRFHLLDVPPFWYGLRIITPNLVRSAHLRGLRVHAVNINEYNEMQLIIQQGIDGILTDYPNLLIDAIHAK
jgi:glycerophosphoryl diester phosphodiesterase